MSKWFVIRADGSKEIGFGHMMRCLALAEWASKSNISAVLVAASVPVALHPYLDTLQVKAISSGKGKCAQPYGPYVHSSWLTRPELVDAKITCDIIQVEAHLRGAAPEFVVVDHYGIAGPWERKIGEIAPVIAVDDLADRIHECSLLIDQTLGRKRSEYEGLLDKGEALLGPEYALLRPEFFELKSGLQRNPISELQSLRILITLGGVDKYNSSKALLLLLDSIRDSVSFGVTLILGGGNSHVDELKSMIDELGFDVSILVNVSNMAQLMAEHDLCIGAAGSTSWERCAMALPTLNVVLAENQIVIAEQLKAHGVGINLGRVGEFNSDDLLSGLKGLLAGTTYMDMVRQSIRVCDGEGCRRILDRIRGTLTC